MAKNSRWDPKVQRLRKSGWAYGRILAAEFQALAPPSDAPRGATKLGNDAYGRLSDGGATWSDVHDLEIAILELQPEADLRRRAWSLREDYRAGIGDVLFTAYKSSLPAGLDSEKNVEDLRADLRQVLAELHRLRAVDRAANDARKRSLGSALVGLLIVLAIAGLGQYLLLGSKMRWVELPMSCGTGSATTATSSEGSSSVAASVTTSKSPSDPAKVEGSRSGNCSVPILPLVIVFGGVGGFLSTMQRINTEQAGSVKSLENAPAWPMALAPPIGAIGAIAIYLILSGNLISGTLFPYFDPKDTDPMHYVDFAKLMLWSFVAGFSERLVPDALDWLAQSGMATLRASSPLPSSSTQNGGAAATGTLAPGAARPGDAPPQANQAQPQIQPPGGDNVQAADPERVDAITPIEKKT